MRWRPSGSAGVGGYRVYLRAADDTYDTGRDVGVPPLAADGSHQWMLTGLDSEAGYAVVVTAYSAADLVESARSNELTLDAVVPEPPPDPVPTNTFGNPTIGTVSQPVTPDMKRASRFTLDGAGRVSELWMYLSNPGPLAQRFRPLVYGDAEGSPGALLAAGPETTVPARKAAGWISLPFAMPVPLQPGGYWLGVHADGGGPCLFFSGVDPDDGAQNVDVYGNGPSNPFGAAVLGLGPLSIFAEYDPTIITRTDLPPHWFGKPTVGNITVPLAAEFKRVSPFQLPEAGDAIRLWMYLANPSVSWQSIRGLVYADVGGAPGPLVATSDEVFVPPGLDSNWVALPLDAQLRLDAGRYWLGAVAGSNSLSAIFFTDTVPAGRVFAFDTYADGVSDPFGPSTAAAGVVSIYAEYEPTDATRPPTAGFFGNPRVEGLSAETRSHRRHASPFDLDEPAFVTRLRMYLANPGNETQIMRAVIYADENGEPGALVAVGNEILIGAGAPAAWVPLPFTSPVVMGPGRYWIGNIAGPSSSVRYYYGSRPDLRARRNDYYFNGPNERFGNADIGVGPISIYAEYLAAARDIAATTAPDPAPAAQP